MTTSSREAKYVSIFRQLKSQIEEGILAPGAKMPTFVEMRSLYGVVPTTVDRIYTLLEQEGLISREQGRGTFVKVRPIRPQTGTIGLRGSPLSLSSHPYYSKLIDGIQSTAEAAGIELLLLNQSSEIKWEKVDGVISYTLVKVGSSLVIPQLPPTMPGVTALMADPAHVSVIADEYQGAYDLTQHLLGLGHKRIAYLYDPLSLRRRSGYHDALREAGIEPQPCWEYAMDSGNLADFSYSKLGHDSMAHWLINGWKDLKCTALMTQNDDNAIGAIQALRNAGLVVPEDVSVTGFDGTEVGSYFMPALTSVEVPLREIGATAMEILLRQIQGENVKISTIVLPVRLLPRQSTTRSRIS